MLAEYFLDACTAHLTRRYLDFNDCPPALPPRPEKNKSYMLYMHIPFCEELCPYCSFIRVKFDPSLACSYFDALEKEIELYYRSGYHFDSLHIGGGTPTVMPKRLAEVIKFIKSNSQVRQISVETNPNHLKPEILQILKDVGANRLSVGVQSFNNEILKNTQRLEKYGTGQAIKERLSSLVGMFDTLNIDMIFNFPSQTEQMLAEDIQTIKDIGADQITYYPLIISNYQKKEITKRFGTINYNKERRLHQQISDQLADMYNQESIWCFSTKKGLIDEYIMNHDEYAGVGAGAMGYIDGTINSNTCSIQQYINFVQQGNTSITKNRKFSNLQRMRYRFMLRLLSGTVKISDMTKKYGKRFWFYLSGELSFLLINRAIKLRGNHIVLTPTGRYYCLVLMRTLFSIVGDFREVQSSFDSVQFAELVSGLKD